MSAKTLSVLCFLLPLSQITAGSLVLDVSPRDITPGVTHSLTVNCSFSFDGPTDIVNIMSLIIAKENQQQFEDLVSISVFRPDQITETAQLDATVSGSISHNDPSFVSIHWSLPTASEGGLYRCEVSGVNSSGRPAYNSQTVMVVSQNPSHDELITKVSDLQGQLDRQEILIQTQSDMISTLLNRTADLKDQLELDNLFFPFYRSTTYKGHYYLASKLDWKNSNVSETICEAYGGYLAEIDDQLEDRFVKEFLDSLDGFDAVLISGTREGHPDTDTWTYTYSGEPLTYTNWIMSRYPSHVCIYRLRFENWQYRGFQCSHDAKNYRFLCEVNVN